MKTKFITLAIAILGFSSATFAQSEATAAASATLLTPLSITKDKDLNFGNIASSNEAGTAVLTTGGVVSSTGGVAILDGVTPPAAAKFTVVGASSETYSMQAPASIVLTSGSTNLNLSLVYDKAASGNLLTGGSSVILVGGTLSIPANTVAGTYTNPSGLKITVNYE